MEQITDYILEKQTWNLNNDQKQAYNAFNTWYYKHGPSFKNKDAVIEFLQKCIEEIKDDELYYFNVKKMKRK